MIPFVCCIIMNDLRVFVLVLPHGLRSESWPLPIFVGVSCALGSDLTCSVNASGGIGACVDTACIITSAATTAAGVSSSTQTTSTSSLPPPTCNLLSCRNRPLWKCGACGVCMPKIGVACVYVHLIGEYCFDPSSLIIAVVVN